MKKERLVKKFLKELRKIPVVQVACERAGLTRQTVYRWRQEDSEFLMLMDDARREGEELVNDMCESQMLTLIKEKNFRVIQYWLRHHHETYGKPKVETPKEELDSERVLKEMGLTETDFEDEKIDETTKRIMDHLSKYG